jgi:hypothetical protein
MKKLTLLLALFSPFAFGQSDVFLRSRGLDTNLQLCVNDGGVDKCPIVLEGALGSSRIGGATSTNLFSGEPPHLQIDNGSNTQGLSITRSTENQFSGSLFLGKSRGSNGSPGAVVDNDFIGNIKWQAHDGTDFFGISAEIRAEIDGTTGTGDVPGALVFSTTPDGADSPTERMRIRPSGEVALSSSITTATGSAANPAYSFNGDEDSGMYGTGAGALLFSTNGTANFEMNSNGVFWTKSLGSTTLPSFSWIDDNDTGIYRSSANRVSISGGNTEVARFRNGGLQIQDGSVSAPGYSFLSDPGEGLYRDGDSIRVAVNGITEMYIDVNNTGLRVRSSPTGGTAVCHANPGNVSDLRACTSTKRHKDNIQEITENNASKFYNLRGVRFDWKGDGEADYGMVAEEVLPYFPELIDYDSEGEVVAFNYRHYTGILTKVIQMQKAEINALTEWVCQQPNAPELCDNAM